MGAFAVTLLDTEVDRLADRIRYLSSKEAPVARASTVRETVRLLAPARPDLAQQFQQPAAPEVRLPAAPLPEIGILQNKLRADASRDEVQATADKLLSAIERSGDDPAAYDFLATVIRQYELPTGTDSPSVRARLALADLRELLRTDTPPALSEFKGRTVVLNFWATWCGPCQAEMVFLDRLHREGVAILAVTDESPEVVQSFMTKHGYQVKVVLDPERKIFDRFHASALPATRILDATGRLRAESFEISEAELRGLLRTFQRP